jgi:hypothetical protein
MLKYIRNHASPLFLAAIVLLPSMALIFGSASSASALSQPSGKLRHAPASKSKFVVKPGTEQTFVLSAPNVKKCVNQLKVAAEAQYPAAKKANPNLASETAAVNQVVAQATPVNCTRMELQVSSATPEATTAQIPNLSHVNRSRRATPDTLGPTQEGYANLFMCSFPGCWAASWQTRFQAHFLFDGVWATNGAPSFLDCWDTQTAIFWSVTVNRCAWLNGEAGWGYIPVLQAIDDFTATVTVAWFTDSYNHEIQLFMYPNGSSYGEVNY